LSNYWTKKTITISGHIIGTSISDLDTKIDTLKQNLAGEELNLDIDYAGGTRRYIATVRNITIEREHYNASWCPFSIEFVCADPFGRASSAVTEQVLNKTTASFSLVFSMTGSVPAYPTLTLHFDSANTVSAVQIENITTDCSMTVTRSFAASSDLVVDCNLLTVTYNTANQDYSGIYPNFVLGINTIMITVTSTAHQADLTVAYTPLYI
jgi:phage-related protein